MRKEVLSDRFNKLSKAFKESAFRHDLSAMSQALKEMDDERYKSVLAEGVEIDSSIPSAEAQSFAGKGGYSGSVIELNRIIEHLGKNQQIRGIIENLPSKVFNELKSIRKLLESSQGNAFKWASDDVYKEAIFGMGEKNQWQVMRTLLKFLEKYKDERSGLMPDVVKHFDGLRNALQEELKKAPPTMAEKLKGKTQEMGKAVGDKAKEVGDRAKGLAEKGMQKVQDFGKSISEKYEKAKQQKIDKQNLKNEAFIDLKKYLASQTPYLEIFYRLPPELIKRLDSVGLGADDIKSVENIETPLEKAVQQAPSQDIDQEINKILKSSSSKDIWTKSANDFVLSNLVQSITGRDLKEDNNSSYKAASSVIKTEKIEKKAEETKFSVKKASDINKSVINFNGIEMSPSMEDINISEAEKSELDKLF